MDSEIHAGDNGDPASEPPPAHRDRKSRNFWIWASAVAAILAVAATAGVYLVLKDDSTGLPGAAESATVTPDSRPGNGAAPAPSESGKGSVGTKPSTSPKPSGTAKPPASALDYWPSEANTGVPKGTALKPSGSITVTKSGTVIEGLEVTGCITIKTSNVTIRKTKINAVGCGVKTDLEGTYKNVLVEDVEIDGKGDLKLWLIGWTGFTCRRCYLHGGFSGAHPRSNTVIEDSYIITTSPGGSSEGRHLSGIGFHGGKGMVIRHNRVECPVDGCSAALSLYGNFELVEDVLVEDNYFHGGSYCTYAGSVQSKPFPYAKNVRYLNNAFSKMGVEPFPKCGRHGPVTSYEHGNGNEWTGNYWFDEKKTPITIK